MRSSVHIRWLVAGVLVPLLAAALVACGSKDQVGDQIPANATQSTASSAGTSPTATKQAPAAHHTVDTLLPAMKAAMKDNPSTHLAMEMIADGQTVTAEGDVRYGAKNPVMSLTMQMPGMPGSADLRMVDGMLYVSIPQMTPRGKFLALDPGDHRSPVGALMGNVAQQMDPLGSFAAWDAGLRTVKYLGEESVSGEDLDRYRLTVNLADAVEAQGLEAQDLQDAPETIAYDVWVDGDDLMRRVEFDMGGQGSVVLTFSDWGKPVTVEAPPPGRLLRAPTG